MMMSSCQLMGNGVPGQRGGVVGCRTVRHGMAFRYGPGRAPTPARWLVAKTAPGSVTVHKLVTGDTHTAAVSTLCYMVFFSINSIHNYIYTQSKYRSYQIRIYSPYMYT